MARMALDHFWVCPEEAGASIVELHKNEGSGAVRNALRDLIERGPALRFRIPRADGNFYVGLVDCQRITVSSEKSFGEVFRTDFEEFLKI